MGLGDWNAAGGGNWADAINWDFGSVPNGVGAFANFFTSNAAPGGGTGFRDIDLQGATYTVGFLNFESDDDTWYRPTNGTINLQVSGGSAFIFDNSAPAVGVNVETEIATNVTMSSNATFSIANADTTLEISGDITGAGDITKIGDGRLLLTGTGNTAEIAAINAGTLAIGGNGASIGGNNNFDTITINAGGTLELTPFLTDFVMDFDTIGAGDVLINAINATVVMDDGDLEHTGATRITSGTLEINFDFRLNDTSGIEVTGLGVLDLNDTFQEVIKGVSGNGIIRGGAGSAVDRFWLDITADQTFDGNFMGDVHVKVESASSGIRSLTLTGNSTHTGPTTAEGAEIILSGSTVGLTNSTVVLDNGILNAVGVSGVDSARINDLATISATLNDLFIGGSGLHITEADDFLSLAANTLNIFGDNNNDNRLRVDMAAGSTTADFSPILFVNWDAADTITINGTTASDTITGTSQNDVIDADMGNAGNGNDTINGGGGDDTISGGKGDDVIDGGTGFDFVNYNIPNISGLTLGAFVDLAITTSQGTGFGDFDTLTNVEGLIGSNFRDDFKGDGNNNWFKGGLAGDTFDGRGGNDTLEGEAGDDSILGGDGDDIIIGGAGADSLDGGAGIDTLSYADSSAGVNVNSLTGAGLLGDAAGDSFTGFERVVLSDFDDGHFGVGMTVNAGAGNDTLQVQGGTDSLAGEDGNDFFDIRTAFAQVNSTFDGGNGTDSIRIFGGAGIQDLRDDTLISNEILFFFGNPNDLGVHLNAAQVGQFETFNAAFHAGHARTVEIDMDTETSLDLSGVTVTGFTEPNDGITITGDSDAETITGSSVNDTIIGGAGADSMDGGAGIDTAGYGNAAAGVKADLVNSGVNTGDATGDTYTAIENLDGSAFADDLRGDNGANQLSGNGGNDFLTGRNGDDVLIGGAGNDVLVGGQGGDSLDGGDGRDIASYADSGTGVLVDLANIGFNTGIAAGDSYSSIEVVIGSGSADDLRGDASDNQLEGRNGDDYLVGRAGDDDLRGGSGDDILLGGAGADRHDGGAGIDTANYADSATGMVIDLASNGLNTGIAAGDGYISIENVIGSGANDDMRGNNDANRIEGRNGNDFLFGRAGDDTLVGGDGDDNMRGGQGGDVLNGGNGIDSANYIDSAGLRADLQNAAVNNGVAAGDTYISVENLFGSNGGDDLRGDTGANRLIGRDGNDFLTGRDGDDELFGGNGDDLLRGGNGADTLTGNAGDDRFRFDSVTEGVDTIRDFQINRDTIQLNDSGFTSLSTGALSAANFHVGTAAADGDDYIIYDNGDLYYDADGNGSGAQVLFATLQNSAAIDQNDFFII